MDILETAKINWLLYMVRLQSMQEAVKKISGKLIKYSCTVLSQNT